MVFMSIQLTTLFNPVISLAVGNCVVKEAIDASDDEKLESNEDEENEGAPGTRINMVACGGLSIFTD